MKLIRPSYEILTQGPGEQGIYDMIETCGKVSYKSEPKGGDTARYRLLSDVFSRFRRFFLIVSVCELMFFIFFRLFLYFSVEQVEISVELYLFRFLFLFSENELFYIQL